jgi:hypothetical protein
LMQKAWHSGQGHREHAQIGDESIQHSAGHRVVDARCDNRFKDSACAL